MSYFVVTNHISSSRLCHFIDTVDKTTLLSIQDIRKILKAVISATVYCHSKGVIIRNLTPCSIVVERCHNEDSFRVMLADFNLAVTNISTCFLLDHPLFELNNVPYMAPEALLGLPYGTAMDMWSIGVLLYSMVSGELPFDSPVNQVLVNAIKFALYDFSSRVQWPTAVRDLVRSVLVTDPGARPTCRDVAWNRWLLL